MLPIILLASSVFAEKSSAARGDPYDWCNLDRTCNVEGYKCNFDIDAKDYYCAPLPASAPSTNCGNLTCSSNQTCIASGTAPYCLTKGEGGVGSSCKTLSGSSNDDACSSGYCDPSSRLCATPPTPTTIPTLTLAPKTCDACDADMNKDNIVNALDSSLVQSCLGQSPQGSCANADINKDGKIDSNDTACISQNYLKFCTSPTPTSTQIQPSSLKWTATGNTCVLQSTSPPPSQAPPATAQITLSGSLSCSSRTVSLAWNSAGDGRQYIAWRTVDGGAPDIITGGGIGATGSTNYNDSNIDTTKKHTYSYFIHLQGFNLTSNTFSIDTSVCPVAPTENPNACPEIPNGPLGGPIGCLADTAEQCNSAGGIAFPNKTCANKKVCCSLSSQAALPTPVSQSIQCNIDTDEGQYRCRSNCLLYEIVVGGSTTCSLSQSTPICCIDHAKRLPTPTPIPTSQCISSNDSTRDDCFKRYGVFCGDGSTCAQSAPGPKDCVCKAISSLTPTGVPGATVAPPAVPTPTPVPVILSFDLALEGIGSGRDNVNSKRVTLEILNEEAQKLPIPDNIIPAIEYNQADGRFKRDLNIGNQLTPNKDYIFRIKTDGYLKKQSKVIHIDSAGKPESNSIKTTLLAGDIDNNGVVDATDYNFVHDCYASKFTTSLCKNKAADVDRDGKVTIIDFNIEVRNYGKKDD